MNMEATKVKKVLTVDDDEFVREILAAYLEDSGYEVLQAENGRLGLELFQRETPDLVMLDLRMPEMDGLEVLKKITEESPDTPVDQRKSRITEFEYDASGRIIRQIDAEVPRAWPLPRASSRRQPVRSDAFPQFARRGCGSRTCA